MGKIIISPKNNPKVGLNFPNYISYLDNLRFVVIHKFLAYNKIANYWDIIYK